MFLNRSFKIFLVGAGSAGAVMANRLSENPHMKVLLIEAGGKENLVTDIPLAAAMLQMTPIDWAYQTEPQEAACFGLINRVSSVHRSALHHSCNVASLDSLRCL